MAERIVIRNTQSPGDYVVLTAAIRDICKMYPGRFEFFSDTPQPAVFLHSPYAKPIKPSGTTRMVVAKYPMIHKSNQMRLHFIWGFLEYLNSQLGTGAVLTELRPDLHLTPEEKAKPILDKKPYWVFASGGKKDFTAKWWDPWCWQQVANMLQGKVNLVQVGGGSHVHPPIRGVHDLVNKTSFRQLMQLIYHSEGVISIVTCLMHIAAAFNKPCIVVSGGREPWWWEAYNHENRLFNLKKGQPNWAPPANDNYVPHRFLHTIGQLDCCKNGGCWKSRIEPNKNSCTMPVSQHGVRIPKCLQLITPEQVVENLDWYYNAGILSKDGTPKLITGPTPALELQPVPTPQAEAWLPESITIQMPKDMGNGKTAELFAKMATASNSTWFVWQEGQEQFAAGWEARVFERLNKGRFAGGFVYRNRSSRAYYLKSRLVVMPAADAHNMTPPDGVNFEEWLGFELQRRGFKLIDIGDLVLQ